MKMLSFAKRNTREIVREPINVFFGLGFPLVLLLLMSAIQKNVPVPLFEIERLAPGVAVFGFSFVTLFSAFLISKDRGSSFLQRLYTTPLTPADFILGYVLPLLPIAFAQGVITYLVAIPFGLSPNLNMLVALLCAWPISLLFIALGLLFGSILNDKQVGGVCGALLTNLTAWLSGIWFDLSLIGGAFVSVAKCLPFFHAVEMERAAICGNFAAIPAHLAWVLAYAALFFVLAILAFLRQMRRV